MLYTLADGVVAEWTRGSYLEPFQDAFHMEVMVAWKQMQLCSIFIWIQTYAAILQFTIYKTNHTMNFLFLFSEGILVF